MDIDELELERQETGWALDMAFEADQRASRAEELATRRYETIKELTAEISRLTNTRPRGWRP